MALDCRPASWSALHPGLARLPGWLSGNLLTAEPPCCAGCLPAPGGLVIVEGLRGFGPAELDGELIWRDGWVMTGARRAGGIGRRRVLAAAPLLCLAAAGPAPAGRDAIADAATVDMHSHAGRLLRLRHDEPFTPVAGPMREGGLAVTCLAIVSDQPTHRVMADGRIHPFRDPAPGELYAYSQRGFARLHKLAEEQGLRLVADAAALRAARAGQPAAIVCAEGGDFLEGDPARIDEAYHRWQLRHLQLVHYRVNELGDIQTEDPVHNGLTEAGAAVVRRCNELGVVVDVAHATLETVRGVAAVTRKPLVLSHTSLTTRPRPYTRLITPEHAAVVAGTGGVIGIWPVRSLFPDMAAMAGGIARMVAVAGVDHVGLGTDQMGLVGPATFESYSEFGGLADALSEAGFGAADIRKILGGNYERVFSATVV